ncbi:hypothetical protein J3Q64DRAFT_1104395 [Phycomyces blakesleeanus]|uniref:Uncharacterized protein n=1 Tax=Phycomyces blakesleeanus TaxID=4837 RepID=A0ABR3AZK9_PHYBL
MQDKAQSSKASYDKAALRERKKILGSDPEQSILILILKACTPTFSRPDFGKTLQSIKANFVQRDYEGIFTDAENLQVYSAAYVPGRALCYYEIFCRPQLSRVLAKNSLVYAVGSGSGSELVSIAAAMTRAPADRQKVHLAMQDIGEWADVLGLFEEKIRTDWKLTTDQLTCIYEQGDVLSTENEARRTELISSADLITFMFVMNELFHLKVGDKTYMVYTLLDAVKDLECLISENSLWYRHPSHLKYSIDVQNMRYFIRLYKKK